MKKITHPNQQHAPFKPCRWNNSASNQIRSSPFKLSNLLESTMIKQKLHVRRVETGIR